MHSLAAWLILGPIAGAPAMEPPYDPALPSQEGEQEGEQQAESSLLFIKGERVHVRPGVVLEDAAVIVRDGLVERVGRDLTPPEGAEVIAGAVVCAGFIDPWTGLGLDAGSVADASTTASTRALHAFDPWSPAHLLREALAAGVTCARVQSGERSSFGGIGTLVRLVPEGAHDEVVVLAEANLAAAVGQGDRRGGDPISRVSEIDRLVSQLETGLRYREEWVEYRHGLEAWEKAIREKEAELEKDFKKAQKDREKARKEAEEKGKEFEEKKYKEDKKPKRPKTDPDKEVLARVAHGELPLVVRVNRAALLRNLLDATDAYDRMRLVIAGGTEAASVAERLAARSIPVIVWPAPLGEGADEQFEGHDLALAAKLADAGVPVLIGSGGEARATRDLPLLAALAVGHGLDRQLAFHALTLGAAEALDVADRLGSLEPGKSAEVLVLDGPPLASTTRARYVVAGGNVVVRPD